MYTQCLKRNQYSTNSIYRYNYYSVSATAFFSPKLENIIFILPTDTKSIIEFQWLFLENVPHNCPLVSISSATFLIYLPYFIFLDFVLGNQIVFLKTCFSAPLFPQWLPSIHRIKHKCYCSDSSRLYFANHFHFA